MEYYLWYKWLHIVAIISWMAGLLYVYRIFIYHQEKGQNSKENHELLSMMAKKLLNIITIPAFILAWFCGLKMLHLNPKLISQGWMHSKIFLVLCLSISTFAAKYIQIRLAHKMFFDLSKLKMRIINEIPTILMMLIVAMVVFRPI
jgi:protoporphyrinogen IX oxidase